MSVEQRSGFEERRLELMRKHIDKNPLVRAYYRKRRRALFGAFLGSVVVVMLVLVMLKSFIIAYEGQGGYERMVAPVLAGQAPDGLVVRLLRPDPISEEIASMIVSILPARAPVPVPSPAFAPQALQGEPDIFDTQDARGNAQSADMTVPANPQDMSRPRAVLQLAE